MINTHNMKIKIRESQYNNLLIIVEHTEQLDKFKKLCNEKIIEVNKLYTNLITHTVDDLVRMSFDAEKLLEIVNNIDNEVSDAERTISDMYDSGYIDGQNLDADISRTSDIVMGKINALSLLLHTIYDMQRYETKHKFCLLYTSDAADE